MRTLTEELNDKVALDRIIEKAVEPTIISISRKHSFGAQWLNRMLKKVLAEYEDEITIHTFYLEDPVKLMSLLGEGKSMITYFIKDKEIKSRLTGSVAKSLFDKKLSTIVVSSQ